MKLVLFDDHRPGRIVEGGIVDLSSAVGSDIMGLEGRRRMNALIEGFEALRPALEAVSGPVLPLESVRLRAPSPQPRKMMFAQGNYFENTVSPVLPLAMFLKAPSSILDPGGVVELSDDDAIVFHHEAELGVVIGKAGRDIAVADALTHVFGFCCLIDVSARGVGRGLDFADKSPDTFCPLGPWIATRDEIANPQRLGVRLSVNGEPRQDYSTDDMEHPVAELVAWASSVSRLEPGDVIACGTNHAGLGTLQDGDEVAMTIDGLGTLRVSVHDRLDRRWPAGIDEGMQAAVIRMRTEGVVPAPGDMFQRRRIR